MTDRGLIDSNFPEYVRVAYNRILNDIKDGENDLSLWKYRGQYNTAEIHPLASRNNHTRLDYNLIIRLSYICSPWVSIPPARITPHKAQMLFVAPLFGQANASIADIMDTIDSLRRLLGNNTAGYEFKLIILSALLFCDVIRYCLPRTQSNDISNHIMNIVRDSTANLNWGIPYRPKRDKLMLVDEVLQVLESERQYINKCYRLRVAYRIGVLFGAEDAITEKRSDEELFDIFRKRKKLFINHIKKHRATIRSPEQIGWMPNYGSRFSLSKYLPLYAISTTPYGYKLTREIPLRIIKNKRRREH